MKVIFSNDDFGLNFGTNRAVKDGFTKGLTTNTSILVNGVAYKDAVRLLKKELKKIGLGIHLNLTDGISETGKLCNKDHNFNNSFLSLLIKVKFKKSLLKDIEREFEKQIFKIFKENLTVDHLDSDKHVHMIPEIFEITCKLAKKYKIKYVRLTRENYYLIKPFGENLSLNTFVNIFKVLILNVFAKMNIKTLKKYNLKTSDSFCGLLHSNCMTENKIKSCLENALSRNYNTVEVLSHPSYTNDKRDTKSISPLMEKYSKLHSRMLELRTIQNQKLLDYLNKKNILRSRFGERK